MLIGTISPYVCAAAFCVVGHTVNLGGHRIGSYADDTWTGSGGFPEQCRFVADQRRTWPLVIAGMEIGDQNHTCKGAVMALQWLPYWGGRDHLGPLPCGHQAYILQWTWAWGRGPIGTRPPFSPPPTVKQRMRLLARAQACHPTPKFVLLQIP